MATKHELQLVRGLVDTNVLVYAWRAGPPQHRQAFRFRARAIADRDLAVVAPQILTEFYRTVTNPRMVDPPATPEAALQEVVRLRSLFDTAYPGQKTSRLFEDLVRKHKPTSARVFDYYLAATALAFGLTRLYTFNAKDFAGIEGLEAVEPPSNL
jgi:toxin-antitoxin system PIN domain toxin